MTYAVAFDATRPTWRFQRAGVELAVQRFDARRWVAFRGTECVGTGKTREEAANTAARAVGAGRATAAEVVAQAAAEERAPAAARADEAVTMTPDIRRWFNLPSAQDVLGVDPAATWTWEPMARAFSDPPVRLRAFQAWALTNAAALRDRGLPGKGLAISAGVGQGKTLIGLLLPTVLRVDPARVVTLVPAALEAQWRADVMRYRDMGFVVPTPTIRTHEALGAGRNPLDLLSPSVVIIDEASAFANGESTRTRRLVAWKAANPNARVFVLSATYLKASLKDLAGLMDLVLAELAPVPTHYPDLRAVASAVDADARLKRYAPGVLLDRAPLTGTPLQRARAAVRNLMAGRTGYVTVAPDMAPEGETSVPLRYVPLRPAPPPDVSKALAHLEGTWEHPHTGVAYTYALDFHRAATELSAGYYTRWDPPPPVEWTDARRELVKALRATRELRTRGLPDSPGTWTKALRKAETAPNGRGALPKAVLVTVDQTTGTPRRVDLREVWRAWASACARYGTTTALATPFPGQVRTFHRVSPYLVEAAAEWAAQDPAGAILWTRSPDFGEWLANVAGVPYYGTGADGEGVRRERGDRTCVCSVQVHHRGKNLQAFHRNLVVQPFGSADVMEQLVGRTHRAGQVAPVTVALATPTIYPERAVAAAMRRSRFVAEVGEAEHRLWRYGQDLTFDRRALEDREVLQALETEEP